ncbi:ATPase [Colletotrichum sojae]|uniref:ATPase n=1 Tax=Colletotrichum sojae TaxID=2175907 RepID=A0A8H6IZE4_9PEZI|nr:ATPase [Colletotrichum sojae]
MSTHYRLPRRTAPKLKGRSDGELVGSRGHGLPKPSSARPPPEPHPVECSAGENPENDSQDGDDDYYRLPQARHRPKTIIDWRSELCRFLRLSHEPSDEDILEALEKTEEKLRDAERLKSQFSADPGPSRYQVVYTIGCRLAPAKDHETLYLDTPWPVDSGPYHSHLRGSRAITNLELYLERNQNVSFLVYREYSCCYRTIKWQENSDSQQPDAEE